MRVGRDFLHLQVSFARTVAAIQGVQVTELLMEWTIIRQLMQLYVNPTTPNPVWTAYIAGVERGEDPVETAYTLYVDRLTRGVRDTEEPRYWGCFHYAYPWRGEPTVGMHFENRNETSSGALSSELASSRVAELRAMFRHIHDTHRDAKEVRGGSWLYNIPAYRRLFPADYVASAEPSGYETGFWALWGQFIASDGGVRGSTAQPFLESLRGQTTVEGCLNCFPFEVLKPRCDIGVFYDFYGIA